jgi:hypothetical protein
MTTSYDHLEGGDLKREIDSLALFGAVCLRVISVHMGKHFPSIVDVAAYLTNNPDDQEVKACVIKWLNENSNFKDEAHLDSVIFYGDESEGEVVKILKEYRETGRLR